MGMSLAGTEFLHRFCLHILPAGFRRLLHYGILANAVKSRAPTAARSWLRVEPPPQREAAERCQEILTNWPGTLPLSCTLPLSRNRSEVEILVCYFVGFRALVAQILVRAVVVVPH
jgi:hypothetical protein